MIEGNPNWLLGFCNKNQGPGGLDFDIFDCFQRFITFYYLDVLEKTLGTSFNQVYICICIHIFGICIYK